LATASRVYFKKFLENLIGILFIFAMVYKFVAIPIGMPFVFFLTRRLARTHSFSIATGIALAWTTVIFTPLVTPARSFFDDIYAPWYLALTLTPPAPVFSVGALLATIAVSLASSGLAVLYVQK
jgi:hypothetical protein